MKRLRHPIPSFRAKPARPAASHSGAPRAAVVFGVWIAALAMIAAVSGAPPVWHSEAGVRWRALEVPTAGQPGFSRLSPAATGVAFTNGVDEWSGAANRVLYNGSGVAAGDFDGDGWPDIFLCDLGGTNRLFRNLGDWRFEDVTRAAGLSAPGPLSRGAVFADVNGDTHLDLLVSVTGRGVRCFLNEGQGRFHEVTETAGTASQAGSTTMALADVDGNGTLDLYVANYRPDDIRDRGRAKMTVINGRPVMAGMATNRFIFLNGRLEECGQPDQLLLNDGTGHFAAVSWTGGAFRDESGQPLKEPPPDWGLTATFRDVNGDGAPDLYVCNDYWTPDRFWINDGHGRFQAIERTALRRTSASSMSVDFADVDRDGYLDFFVVDMLSRYPALRKRQMFAQTPMGSAVGVTDDRPQIVQNTLFLNRHDGTFAEIAGFAGMTASDWSWAPVFLDVDLDGYEDLVIGAGHFRDVQDYDAEAQVRARQHSWEGFTSETERQRAFTQELLEHNRLYPLLRLPIGGFRNLGGSGRFAEVTKEWGLNHDGVHQGLALADFDQDGDLDLVVNNLNEAAALYRNESPAGRVAVRLKGEAPNTQGIGARVSLSGGAVPRQTSEVICGGRYQSGADTQVTFATGTAATNMTLEVHWRQGRVSRIAGVQANRLYEIDENGAPAETIPPTPEERPVFEDVSRALGHRHPEVFFDDYERQPLLPFKLSQLGPGVAWSDLDGDGHEDLAIGAGRGGSPTVFRGDGHGGFAAWPWSLPFTAKDDLAGFAAWSDAGTNLLLAAFTGYEAAAVGINAFRVDGGRLTATPVAGAPVAGPGSAMAISDPLGDGRLSLFVGGGVLPGQYPLGAPSRLFRLEGRQWRLDAKNSGGLANLGIVNAAVWSDLDGDGFAELILACEWGPVRVFKARGEGWFEVTREMGLEPYVGWWRGVTTGDFNNDGRMDIIAANWGLNSPYQASAERPLTFVFGQITQPGVTDIIETEWVGGALTPRRQWRSLANSMPFLLEAFPSHLAYSEATVERVLGERLPLSRRVSATTLASTLFLNTGRGFTAVPLPREAQFAPAFGVCVADFDGDGNEDVFLSQNFFATAPEMARLDAGTGLLLRGEGTGQFTVVDARRAGIRIEGEQRGAAVADFDEDGRADLAVAQNGAATRLFRNATGRPGLRVRLRGPAGNPTALGAVIRLQLATGPGPAREVHGGAGYWSQDSLTQVMGWSGEGADVWVRWPGGRTTTTALPAGAREIVIDPAGRVVSPP